MASSSMSQARVHRRGYGIGWADAGLRVPHRGSDPRLLGRKEEELDRKAFEERLNALGGEGWEFEKMLTDMALHGEKDGHVLVFKRVRG